MKLIYYLCALAVVIVGCTRQTPVPLHWDTLSVSGEMEYQPYLEVGNATIMGQAFLTQRGGGVVKAAGRTVTLDPATSLGKEWWQKVGGNWSTRSVTPPSAAFKKARRTTVADADGRFKFKDLPPGQYYIRTEVTWEVPSGRYSSSMEGGLVGQLVEVQSGQTKEVIVTY